MLERIVSKIANIFFIKYYKKYYKKYLAYKSQSFIKSSCEYRIVSFYQKNMSCEVSRLCDIYGSDKGS